MANWSADALAARFHDNPELGIHPQTIGNLNVVTKQEEVARNIRLEYDLQKAAFDRFAQIALVHPLFRLIHPVPNGQYRSGQRPEAGLSFSAGYPDIAWDLVRGGYHGLRVELKVGKNNLSDDQIWWHNQLRGQGFYVTTIWDSLEKIIDLFMWYYQLGG